MTAIHETEIDYTDHNSVGWHYRIAQRTNDFAKCREIFCKYVKAHVKLGPEMLGLNVHGNFFAEGIRDWLFENNIKGEVFEGTLRAIRRWDEAFFCPPDSDHWKVVNTSPPVDRNEALWLDGYTTNACTRSYVNRAALAGVVLITPDDQTYPGLFFPVPSEQLLKFLPQKAP